MKARFLLLRTTQVFVVLAALALGVAPAFAVDTLGVFELEGNAAINDAPGDDWQTANFPPFGSSLARTGVLVDPAGTTIFTTGGSKDVNDINQWRHTSGSVPDKDEITNAYAAAYSSAGDLIVVAGFDRFANNGDANAGFWFFQQDVGPLPDGTFGPGVHSVGDLLVVVEFTGGGDVATAKVFEWVGGKNPLQLLATSAACTAPHALNDPCAQSNASPIQLFWSYTAKFPTSATPNEAPAGSFIEVGVNVSALFPPGQVPCFSSFLAETRSSAEPNAQLKDFVAGNFDVCGIDITKTCTAGEVNATDTGFVWTFAGSVTNIGFGNLFDVTVIDAGSDQILGTADDIVIPIGTLTGGQTQTFGGTFETIGTSPNPASNIARVDAAVTPGGAKTVTDTSALTNCPPVTKSPDLSVTKECTPRLAVVDNKVVVAIDVSGQVCNIGTITLVNVSVVNDNGTPVITGDDTLLLSGVTLPDQDNPSTPGDERCAPYTGSYFPSSVNAGTSQTNPAFAAFQDTVRANGESVLFGPAEEATASDTCELCPPPPSP